MNVVIENKPDCVIVTITGELGVKEAEAFKQKMEEIDDNVKKIVFKARKLKYITSSGLRNLLILKKRLGKDAEIVITEAQPAVVEVMKLSGFDQMITVEPDSLSADEDKEFFSFKTMVRNKALRRGNAPALWYEGKEYTWNDIDRYSQIIAADLQRIGVKKGSHVGLCGRNSLNWILTFFAIQKLGAITILLNVQLKPHEIEMLTKIGDIEFFCYGNVPQMEENPSYLEEAMAGGIKTSYCFADSVDYFQRADEYDLYKDSFTDLMKADDPSVFLFTSGTTGRPKGILHSAYGMLNSAYVLGERMRMTAEDKSYLLLPLYHIMGFMDSFIVPLLFDGMVYIAPDTRTNSILEIISKYRCTILNSVPTMMLALARNEHFAEYDLSCIRASMMGGAPLLPAQMEMLQNLMPNNHFISGYALSELAPACNTLYEDTREHILNSVGIPLPCVEVKIQNIETGEPCPVGEKGELLIRGVNMMLYYYKLDIDEQNIDGDGWIHTGDVLSIDEDGYLHFWSRIKELIIRGGENIMPNEVASALTAHPQIADAKIFGAPHPVLGERVVAAVIPEEGAVLDKDEIQAFLQDKLAAFKIPEEYVFYKEFPFLANGKVDVLTLKEDVLKQLG